MSNYSKTYLDENQNELKVLLDIESKSDTILNLIFKGNLKDQFSDEIAFLEKAIISIPIKEVSSILKKENLKLNLPSFLIVQFIKEYFGLINIPKRNDLLCSCFGFTIFDLEKYINNAHSMNELNLSDITIATKASLGCGSCSSQLKNEFIKLASNKFKTQSKKENFNELGEWIKYKNLTYGEILISIDNLKNNWLTEINHQPDSISFTNSAGLNIYYKINSEISLDVSLKLEQLVFERLGLLVFFHQDL